MVELLRAVTTSSLYPTLRRQLASRRPDDVWHEAEQGWMIVFPLSSLEPERLALFVVRPPLGQARAELASALIVERNSEGVRAELLNVG